MNLVIRQEEVEDYEVTEKVVKSAFSNAEHSDKKNISWYLALEIPTHLFLNYH